MFDWIKKTARLFSEGGGIFMFLRAQFSSQIASITDFLTTIFLAKFTSLYYVYATFLGSVCGGIVNCIVNYKWTFKSTECNKLHITIKYILVWVGSILLNTWGTYLLTEALGKIPWVKDTLSNYFGNYFLFSKVVVSLLVGFLWNYNMQRVFVYRSHNIKPFFKRKNQI